MALYSRDRGRRLAQLLVDFAMVVWTGGWLVVASVTYGAAERVTRPLAEGLNTLKQAEAQLVLAKQGASRVPGLGGQLAQAIQPLLTLVQGLITQTQQQVDSLHQSVVGTVLLMIVVPVVPMVVIWLAVRSGRLAPLFAPTPGQ